MPNSIFLGHANAAMELDRLPADHLPGARNGQHRRTDSGGPHGRGGIGVMQCPEKHRAGVLAFDEHVSQAVTYALEFGQRPTELFTLADIFPRIGYSALHQPLRFGGHCHSRRVESGFDIVCCGVRVDQGATFANGSLHNQIGDGSPI